MSRPTWVPGLLLVLGTGCAVGPSYQEPAVAPAGTAVGLSARPESMRALFDSLATADSATASAPRTLQPDSADLAWLAGGPRRLLPWHDPEYPPLLRHAPSPPPILGTLAG